MKNLVNIRLPFLFALAFVSGILLTVGLIYKLWIVVAAVFAVAFFLFVVLAVFKKTKAKRLLCLFFTIVVIGMTVSAFATIALRNRQIGTADGVLHGVVTQSHFENTYLRLVLRDCVFVDNDGASFDISGNVSVSMFVRDENQSFDFSIGNKVTVVGTIKNEYIFKSEIKTFNYRNNISMSFFDVTSAISEKGEPDFSESVKLFVLNNLYLNMPENADVAYALLVGDKSFVTDTNLSNFQSTGILHILAVSGLHVGFVVAFLTFVLDKLKLRVIFQVPIILVPLILYMVVCSFSPSITRAVVMVSVSLFSKLIFARSDILNSLSIAAILILLFRPFYIFDAGFLLSFFSVFGIATVTAFCNRAFVGKFVGKKVNNRVQRVISLAFVSLGATLATLPFSAHFFGRVSLVSVFSNLVVVPAISLAFIVTFLGLVPFFGFLLWLPDKIFLLTKVFSQAVAGLPFSAVDFLGVGIFAAVALLLCFFILGGFVNLKPKAKAIVATCLLLVSVCSSITFLLPSDTDFEVFVGESYSECLVVATDDKNTAYVISNLTSAYDIELTKKFLARKKIFEVHLFVYDFKSVDLENAIALSENFPLTKIYVLDDSGNNAVTNYFSGVVSVITVPSEFSTNGNIVVTSKYSGMLAAIEVELQDFSFAIVLPRYKEVAENLRSLVSENVDFLYTLRFSDVVAEAFPQKVVIANSEFLQSNIYALNRYGNFTIKTIDDIIPIWNF